MAGIDLIAEAGFVELPNEPAPKKVTGQAIHGEFYPELGVPTPGAIIPDTKINQWIEESLVYTAQRESFEKDNPLVLTLFRYLGIRHRVLFPQGQSQSYKLDPQLMVKLRKAICDKAVEYFILSVNQEGRDKLQNYPILSSHADQKVQDSLPSPLLAKPQIRH